MKRIFIMLLRLLALGATLAATVVMITSHETSKVMNLTFEAKYSNTPAFKYFAIVNAGIGGYTLIAFFFSLKGSLQNILLVLDMLATIMLTSAISAALAIANVGKKGNSSAGWLPICGQVTKFCDHVKWALVAGFVGALFYFLLLLHSLHIIVRPFSTTKT